MPDELPPLARFEQPIALHAGIHVDATTEIGAYTYSWSPIPASVAKIGRYCSIAHGISLGEFEHPTNWFSTSSFMFDAENPIFAQNGRNRYEPNPLPQGARWRRIEIGNDVWVGTHAFVRSGVTLGHGCIIGAYAIVTKDVPPYAVVVGNPGRIDHYRFDGRTIERLLKTPWWNYHFTDLAGISPSDIAAVLDLVESGTLRPIEMRFV